MFVDDFDLVTIIGRKVNGLPDCFCPVIVSTRSVGTRNSRSDVACIGSERMVLLCEIFFLPQEFAFCC